METITHECYVSLEVAKLLKQAGFDWGLNSRWQDWGGKNPHEFILKTDLLYADGPAEYDGFHALPAPTLSVAQRWLREVKGIYVESVLCVNRGTSGHSFGFSIAEVNADLSIVKILYPLTYFDEEETKGFKKYELSLETGVKKALELILEKGKKK